MKKIFAFILASVGFAAFTACTGVLDTDPLNEPSESVFWQNRGHFESALAACYNGMQEQMLTWVMPTFDALTDNCYGNPGSTYVYNADQIQTDNFDASTTGLIANVYSQCYSAISRINSFLDRLKVYTGEDLSSVRDQFEGEALFLRSYCYYMLWLFYGDVPYVSESVTIDTQDQPKVDKETLYSNILSDLDDAIRKMGDQTYMATGHATRGAARGLKARMLMYHAYGTDGAVANRAEVQEAYDLISQIKGYSLDPEYAKIFRPGDQQSSKEIIFSIKFLNPDNYHQMDSQYGNYGMISPVQDLIDCYESEDIRLLKSIAVSEDPSVLYYQWEGGEVVPISSSTIGKRMVKWLAPFYKAGDRWTQTTRSDQDIIYLRWGELMLLQAEAANELGKTAEAEGLVNQIRKRAGVGVCPGGMGQAEMRSYIRDERRRETPFEMIRIYDMRRWHIMDKLNGLVLDPYLKDVKTAWTASREYWSIPQGQIDLSDNILIQNPNYK
ncbi:MAG: RagB/SusD family nutrient uptake outer membrane protein [Bacteroidales bacterium]|nr:RagB/SusD family nutrient uptake outer membrane protein [Bacteroidales bacterium]